MPLGSRPSARPLIRRAASAAHFFGLCSRYVLMSCFPSPETTKCSGLKTWPQEQCAHLGAPQADLASPLNQAGTLWRPIAADELAHGQRRVSGGVS